MLRVSRIADYGIVLLAHLASDSAHSPHNTRELADGAGLPLPIASKVLKLLTQGGILTSHRGIHGGYSLARPSGSISVAEIIQALERPVALVDCTAGPGHCDHESSCVVRGPWQKINRAILEALERVTLAELLDPPADEFADILGLGSKTTPSGVVEPS